MNSELIEVAKVAVRHYAETHPRPIQVTQRQAATMTCARNPFRYGNTEAMRNPTA